MSNINSDYKLKSINPIKIQNKKVFLYVLMLQVIRQFWWIGIWGIVNTLIFKYMNSFKLVSYLCSGNMFYYKYYKHIKN